MALDFSFKSQFPVAQMVQIMQQKAMQQQQMDLAQQQAKRDQMNQLLNTLTSSASLARNIKGIKADALANQMAQSKMQGTQNLGQLLQNANTPYQGPMMPISQPLGQGMQGPDASMVPQPNPMFSQTPGYQDQLRSALFKASPDIVASQIAKQQFGDPEMEALKKQGTYYGLLNKQLDAQTKQGQLSTSGTAVDLTKASIAKAFPEYSGSLDNMTLKQLEDTARLVSVGDLGSARMILAKTAQGKLDLSQTGDIQKAFDELVPGRASPTSDVGRNVQRLQGAQRLMAVSGTNQGKLMPQQVVTAASEVANLALAGGQSQRIASELIDKYVPNALSMDIAGKIQYLTANPQDAGVQSLVQNLGQEGLRIAQTAEQDIRSAQKSGLTSLAGYKKIKPEDYNNQIKAMKLDPNTWEPTGSVIENFDPAQWYDTIKNLKPGESFPDILQKRKFSKTSTQDLFRRLSSGY